jgi:hypothetical protein
LGNHVSTAGDVNGDGYADVIVSAEGYPTGDSQGIAYLYLGSTAGLSVTPNWIASGENSGDHFGALPPTAGDINGDGYSDVVIGAHGFPNEADQGKAYLYYGSPAGLSSTPDWTATGENIGDAFAISVSVGDINGDGFADLVIGSQHFPHPDSRGKAYVYYGSPTGPSAVPDWAVVGESNGDSYGVSLDATGDINGDGYSDLTVGAYQYPNGMSQGKAYLYLGSPAGPSTVPDWTATGENNGDHYGISVRMAGDVNGDSYVELLVGASRYSSLQGKAYAYYGSPAGPSLSPDWIANGEGAGDLFGLSIAAPGDINGDGFADVITGAYSYDDGPTLDAGKAYVYLGSPDGLSATFCWAFVGENSHDYLGIAAGAAGDTNGDGYRDIVIGAPGFPSGSAQGRAYAFFGAAATLGSIASWHVIGENRGDLLGFSLFTAGDVNGDGYSDAVVGAYGYREGSERGRAYIYHGGQSGLGPSPALTLTGEVGSSNFGVCVSTAGDVNGDGYADVIIGAHHHNINRGRAYVYHGSVDGLEATPAVTLSEEAILSYFGLAVTTAGDVNGDGFGDVLVGAYAHDSYTGRAYLYYGGPTGLAPTHPLILSGNSTYNYYGWSLSGAGDVNGDGYGDVVIGEPGGGDSDTGQAYVYHGGPGGLVATPARILFGEAFFGFFGYTVRTAGDINSDGFSDLLVSAPSLNNASGRVYVYHGSPSGISALPALTLSGTVTSTHFGLALGTVGDGNGDGFADVVIGAPGSESGRGRVYLYHGGANGLWPSPALSLTGEVIDGSFGRATGTAGDVDGDGYADILVGAYSSNGGTGQAYVYRGNGGGGRLTLPRQMRGAGSTVPISPWGLSPSAHRFEVQMRATDPMGRRRVQLQVQACPSGSAFTSPTCLTHTAAVWTDVTTAPHGVLLTETITGLEENTLYRWRARVLYAPQHVTEPGVVPPPNPAHSPWRRLLGQSIEADLRTAPFSCTYGITIVPPNDTASGFPSTTVSYTLALTNTGNCSDTFVSEATTLWPTTIPTTTGPLGPDTSTNITVVVGIPGSAEDGDIDVARITWTSQSDTSITACSELTTTSVAPDIAVSPHFLTATLNPDQQITLTVTITNGGSAELAWEITETVPADWLFVFPISGTVNPSESTIIWVQCDANGLEPGSYTNTLAISSNDPGEGLVSVPVILVVEEVPGREHRIYLPLITKVAP